MDKYWVAPQAVDNTWVVQILFTGLCKTRIPAAQLGRQRLSSNALLTTVTELNAMAAPASMGLR